MISVLELLLTRTLRWIGAFALGGSASAQDTPAEPSQGKESGKQGDEVVKDDQQIWLDLQEHLPQPLAQIWEWTKENPLLSAAILVMLSYAAAKIAEVFLRRGIGRLTKKTRTDLDDRILALARKPIFYTVFLFGLSLATLSLHLPPKITDFTINILATIVVLSWLGAGLPGLRIVLDAIGRHSRRFPLIEERTIPLFDITSKIVLFAGVTYALLAIWQFDPTPWFASAGVIGIAVGFAARDTLANLFAGIFIIADGPYKLGDFITLDSGERGLVTHVGVRSTRLLTRDDTEITLPNAVIGNAKILNESGGRWEKERIRIKVGVAYGSDVDRVCEVLKKVATDHQRTCPEPEPRVRMRAFGDSSLDFELLCWIDQPVLRGSVTHELLMEVNRAFLKEEIEIPFPQRDLWVRRLPTTSDKTSDGGSDGGSDEESNTSTAS